MKEVIIKYKDSKTLEMLKALTKYFNFSISFPSKKKGKNGKDNKRYDYINGIPVIPGDNSIDVKGLTSIFTGKNLDARKIRTEGWLRSE